MVALLIIPAATAYLLTDRLPVMIGLAVACGALSAILGYYVAAALDASVAGAMATVAGVLFGVAFLFAPEQGLIARLRRQGQQRRRFAVENLIVHLLSHEGGREQARESAIAHLGEELRWTDQVRDEAIGRAVQAGLIARANGQLALTDNGRAIAREVLAR